MEKSTRKWNKKGASFSGWTEVILMSVLFLLAFATVIGGMNVKYHQNYDATLGLSTSDVQSAFNTYQGTLQTTTNTGEASFQSVNGLSLSTSWQLMKATGDLIWGVLSGGWTEKLVNAMSLPAYVALIFRILWFISIGFIIITILFKVRP